jgi:peptide chain release factor 3
LLPPPSNPCWLNEIGQLQFEVVLHRLKGEYGVDARLDPCRFTVARWITSTDEHKLKRFIDSEPLRIAYDVVGAPAFLVQYSSDLRVAQERAPDIQFHAMREHSGRVFGQAPTL